MRLPKGVTVVIGNKKFKDEIPDKLLSNAQKKYYEKKFKGDPKK